MQRSVSDELEVVDSQNKNVVLFSYVAMFAYIVLALGRLPHPLKSRIALGFQGIIIVAVSAAGSIGLVSYLGTSWVPPALLSPTSSLTLYHVRKQSMWRLLVSLLGTRVRSARRAGVFAFEWACIRVAWHSGGCAFEWACTRVGVHSGWYALGLV